MKKGIILSAFTLLIGVLALNSCGDNASTPESVGGVLQNSNSVFDPFAPSTSIDDGDNNSSDEPTEEELFARAIGKWYNDGGYYPSGYEFTFEVKSDGSAVLEINDYDEIPTFDFTFKEIENTVYSFTYNDNAEIIVKLDFQVSHVWFSLEDEVGTINDILYAYDEAWVEKI
ncbi:MAG: hypothetical protein J1F32_04790 [Erysipelotrichales bacterium]|nr:hypothetical protein [Erysipelotrichales bacterium]